jgi:pyruvate-formate lyase-activating enzyme
MTGRSGFHGAGGSFMARLFTRGMPRSFIFEVTAGCNLDCPHCYNVWKADPGYPVGQLDTTRTLAMLKRMIREIHFTE